MSRLPAGSLVAQFAHVALTARLQHARLSAAAESFALLHRAVAVLLEGRLLAGRLRGQVFGQRADGRVLQQLDERQVFWKVCCNWLWTCAISSEWPPRSKKLSWTPAFSICSTCRQTAAIVCSRLLRGAHVAGLQVRAGQLGRGQRLAVDLPVGVRGSASSMTKARGHHVVGEPLARKPRSSSMSGDAPAWRRRRRRASRRPAPSPAPSRRPRAPPRARRAPPRSLPARCGSRAP